jgi:acyl transferase domain-containing protein
MSDDVVIIGIGVRFPGDIDSTGELWRVLTEGESKWSTFPPDRLNIDGFFHPSGDRQGSVRRSFPGRNSR